MLNSTLSIMLSVVLLAESILPSLELHELTKVSALLQHYEKHKLESPELTFLQFIEMHYADTEHHQQDHQNHDKLPFSHHQHHHNGTELVATFVASQVSERVLLVPLHEIDFII
jgi:hypothetical protein